MHKLGTGLGTCVHFQAFSKLGHSNFYSSVCWSLRIDAQSEPMASCGFPIQLLCRDLIALVIIHIITQSPWLLRRSLRIEAQSEPMAIAAVYLQLLCRDLRAFVFIATNTQSPWLLRKGLRIDAQSESISSTSTSTITRQSSLVHFRCRDCACIAAHTS